VLHWEDAKNEEHLLDVEKKIGTGNVWQSKRSYDRYSSGKGRSDHIHVWKEVCMHVCMSSCVYVLEMYGSRETFV
jgi:hypothetical protein